MWLDIPGWENLYQVSIEGQVRSLTRTVLCKDGITRTFKGRILSPCVNDSGHLLVPLTRSGEAPKLKQVHRLVLLTFVGPCPPGMECLHWDDDKYNNRLANLRWGTRLENMDDAKRNGKRDIYNDHCSNGHEFTPDNLHIDTAGKRRCRQCAVIRQRAYRNRLKV